MKTIFLMGCIAMSMILMLTNCEKSPANDSYTVLQSSDLGNISQTAAGLQDVSNTMDEFEDELLEQRGDGTCPTVSSTAPKGTYPNVVTIDFGTGCTDAKGRYHAGKIVIEQSDSLKNAGAMRVTTFYSFFIDSVKMKSGKKTLKNLGKDAAGNLTMQRQIENMILTGGEGNAMTLNALHTKKQVQGGSTMLKSDDVWNLSGSAEGSLNDQIVFTSQITETLILRANCPYIVSGQKEVTKDGKKASINFGDGHCDAVAVATLENGDKKLIHLHKRN